MPTGYTAEIAKGITFQQFAMSCARGFGALVMMRDDPADAPIPDEFPIEDRYSKQITEAERRQAELAAMSGEDAARNAESHYLAAVESHKKQCDETADLKAKYEAMLRQVEAWNPPTAAHVQMKEFMREQITESIKFDCHDWEPPIRQSAEEWLLTEKESNASRLQSCVRYQQDEIKRVHERNAWLKALRDSLKA